MQRKEFIQWLSLVSLQPKTRQLNALLDMTKKFGEDAKMPVFFVGHGDPRNAFRDNPFTRSLHRMGSSLPVQPSAILVVSAHWLTIGETCVNTMPKFEVPEYKVSGAPDIGRQLITQNNAIQEAPFRDLDHGAWAILRHISPKADIPVIELSIDMTKPLDYHWQLARSHLRSLYPFIVLIGAG